MTNLLLRAIKRRFSTPEAAMRALGLDSKLLDETRAEVRRARTRRRLAHDAGEVVRPDDDDSEELLAALKELLASGRLGDAQKDWLRACLDGEEVDDDPPGPDDVEDDLPRTGEQRIDHQPTAADRRNRLAQDTAIRNRLAQDADAARRFPNAARASVFKATCPGQARLAYDAHTVPAGVKAAEDRFSFAKRVRPAGAA